MIGGSVGMIVGVLASVDYRQSNAGKPFANVRVTLPQRNGKDNTIEVVAFGQYASNALANIQIGQIVTISATMVGESYTTRNGDLRHSVKVIMESIVAGVSPHTPQPSQNNSTRGAESKQSQPHNTVGGDEYDPFADE